MARFLKFKLLFALELNLNGLKFIEKYPIWLFQYLANNTKDNKIE